MNDDETPEQLAAKQLLEEAIQACVDAYRPEHMPPTVVTAAMAIWAESWYDSDGVAWSSVGRGYPAGSDPPVHVTLGLLDYALTMERHRIIHNDED